MHDLAVAYRVHQQTLLEILSELRDLDRRLGVWAEGLEPSPYELLPGELRGGAQCVRTDLLDDAIATLDQLAQLTEDDAIRLRLQRLGLDIRRASYV